MKTIKRTKKFLSEEERNCERGRLRKKMNK